MTDQPIACNLNAIQTDERGRHADLMSKWQEAVVEVVELPMGYAFAFAPGLEILLNLAEFVGRERLCCPFFHFEIVVEAHGGHVWLRVSGSEATKALIQEAFLAPQGDRPPVSAAL